MNSKYIYKHKGIDNHPRQQEECNEFHYLYYCIGVWCGYKEAKKNDSKLTLEEYIDNKNIEDNAKKFKGWYFFNKGHKFVRDRVNLSAASSCLCTKKEIRKLGHSGKGFVACFPKRGSEITDCINDLLEKNEELKDIFSSFFLRLYERWEVKYSGNIDYIIDGSNTVEDARSNTRSHFIGFLTFLNHYPNNKDAKNFYKRSFFENVQIKLQQHLKKGA